MSIGAMRRRHVLPDTANQGDFQPELDVMSLYQLKKYIIFNQIADSETVKPIHSKKRLLALVHQAEGREL